MNEGGEITVFWSKAWALDFRGFQPEQGTELSR